MHTARGGAGNVISLRDTLTTPGESATGPASLTRLDTHPPKTFTSGRGGAGNVHDISERAIFSFDEELERQMRREKEVAPVFHIGRGGAGNVVAPEGFEFVRRRAGGSLGSSSSASSNTDRLANRARRSFEAGWAKLTHLSP